MLDNFSEELMKKAVVLNNGKAKLEASGNITNDSLLLFASTDVDYISIGALTKNCSAIDLSMQFI